MQLIDDLNARLSVEESYFRQHLIKEDIARLLRLLDIYSTSADEKAFLKSGTMIGWTPDDLRTFELKPTLQPLLAAIHATLSAAAAGLHTSALDERVAAAWATFETDRMERLVGCLARVPRPT